MAGNKVMDAAKAEMPKPLCKNIGVTIFIAKNHNQRKHIDDNANGKGFYF